MGARSKLLVTVAAVACAVALAGCTSQAAPASSSSAANSSSSAASQAAPASSSSASAGSMRGETATIDLDYSAGTGFEWTYTAQPEGVAVLVDRQTESPASGDVAGGPLRDHFTFRAEQPGEVVLTFELARGWEESEPPAETQVYAFTVTDDLKMILNPYKSDFENEPTVGDNG